MEEIREYVYSAHFHCSKSFLGKHQHTHTIVETYKSCDVAATKTEKNLPKTNINTSIRRIHLPAKIYNKIPIDKIYHQQRGNFKVRVVQRDVVILRLGVCS